MRIKLPKETSVQEKLKNIRLMKGRKLCEATIPRGMKNCGGPSYSDAANDQVIFATECNSPHTLSLCP